MKKPKSWWDVSIKEYKEFSQIPKGESNENVLTKFLQVCNPGKTVERADLYDFYLDSAFLVHEPKLIPGSDEFVYIKGQRYSLYNDLNQLSFAEVASIEMYIMNKCEIHSILALLCRPVVNGEIIELEKDLALITQREQLFYEHMSIQDAQNLLGFFLNGETMYLHSSRIISKIAEIKTH